MGGRRFEKQIVRVEGYNQNKHANCFEKKVDYEVNLL